MGKIRRKFDIQFKIQVCQAIENGSTSMTEVCHEHQLQRPTVEAWMARYQSGELEQRTPDRLRQLERENEKLRAKVGELTMSIDVLKKIENWKRQQKSAVLPVITSKNLAQYRKPAAELESAPQASTTVQKGRKR